MIKVEGEREIQLPLEKTWDFISSLDNITQCLPDFKKSRMENDTLYGSLKIGMGPLKGNFDGWFKISEAKKPSDISVVGHASGMGSVVDAKISVKVSGKGANVTVISWVAEINVAGGVAGLVQRYSKALADKLIEDLFSCMQKKLSGEPSA